MKKIVILGIVAAILDSRSIKAANPTIFTNEQYITLINEEIKGFLEWTKFVRDVSENIELPSIWDIKEKDLVNQKKKFWFEIIKPIYNNWYCIIENINDFYIKLEFLENHKDQMDVLNKQIKQFRNLINGIQPLKQIHLIERYQPRDILRL